MVYTDIKDQPARRAQQQAVAMEEELAAIEEDVERKRVAKNPFEERFTSLVKFKLVVSLLWGDDGAKMLRRDLAFPFFVALRGPKPVLVMSWSYPEEEPAAIGSFRSREFTETIDGLGSSQSVTAGHAWWKGLMGVTVHHCWFECHKIK